MLQAIKQFLSDLSTSETDTGGFQDSDYRLAAAALLVHAAVIDGIMSDIERAKLHAMIEQRFKLESEAADELVDAATKAEQESIDLYHFTSLLNRSLDEKGRMQIIEMLWQVAYADGRVTEFEDNLIWRVADLLHVPSRTRLELRARVGASRTPATRHG
jgi:uncharacterized tellurite resistance protein B-like protein